MVSKIISLILFISFINGQIALPTFQGVHKPQVEESCDQTIAINKSDRGWYTSNGYHISSNQNTITGPGYTDAHSWFTFDLSGFSGGACGVTLRLEVERYNSTASNCTSTIYDVSTPHDDLVASHSNGSASGQTIHADLGSGNSYGSATISSSDVGDIIEYTLSAQAISDVNSAAGGWFSIGTTISNDNDNGWVRFSSGSESRTHQIVLEYQ